MKILIQLSISCMLLAFTGVCFSRDADISRTNTSKNIKLISCKSVTEKSLELTGSGGDFTDFKEKSEYGAANDQCDAIRRLAESFSPYKELQKTIHGPDMAKNIAGIIEIQLGKYQSYFSRLDRFQSYTKNSGRHPNELIAVYRASRILFPGEFDEDTKLAEDIFHTSSMYHMRVNQKDSDTLPSLFRFFFEQRVDKDPQEALYDLQDYIDRDGYKQSRVRIPSRQITYETN